VSFFVDRLPPAVKLVCDHVAQILTLGYCIFFAVCTLNQAITGMWEGSTLSAVPIPLAPSYFLVPIGFFAMAILVLVDLPKVAKGESRLLPKSETPDASQSAT
jgi:TRAP-type C4-dicarboxylate transport system permease small subunit